MLHVIVPNVHTETLQRENAHRCTNMYVYEIKSNNRTESPSSTHFSEELLHTTLIGTDWVSYPVKAPVRQHHPLRHTHTHTCLYTDEPENKNTEVH